MDENLQPTAPTRSNTVKINNMETNAKQIAYDGCHKIYLIESMDDLREAIAAKYQIHPIEDLESAYMDSCSLRFINNWKLDKTFVPQFAEEVEFTN
jgi:hypothetical protein